MSAVTKRRKKKKTNHRPFSTPFAEKQKGEERNEDS
jgi:hypothetical protein